MFFWAYGVGNLPRKHGLRWPNILLPTGIRTSRDIYDLICLIWEKCLKKLRGEDGRLMFSASNLDQWIAHGSGKGTWFRNPMVFLVFQHVEFGARCRFYSAANRRVNQHVKPCLKQVQFARGHRPMSGVVKCSLKTSKGIANPTVKVAALPNHLAEHQIPHVSRPEHNLGMLSRLVLATDLRKTNA